MAVKNTAGRVKTDLKRRMENKGLTSALYQSKLDDYMALYTSLQYLKASANDIIANGGSQRTLVEGLKEARQIQKTMRDILDWLGIEPAEEQQEEENLDL